MSRVSVLAILASFGIVLVGPLTKDAIALASALQMGDPATLVRFTEDYPQSLYGDAARQILERRLKDQGNNAKIAGKDYALLGSQGAAMREPFQFRTDDAAKQAAYSESGDDSYGSSGDGDSFEFRSVNPGEVASQDAIVYLQARLLRFQRDVSECEDSPNETILFNCLADEIEKFADQVEMTPPTPNGVAPTAVPVLRAAAVEIRRSRSVGESRAAVRRAIEPISKSLTLIKAGGDDIISRQEALQRSVVLQALATTDAALVKAAGL